MFCFTLWYNLKAFKKHSNDLLMCAQPEIPHNIYNSDNFALPSRLNANL